jgi:hypothetical protein
VPPANHEKVQFQKDRLASGPSYILVAVKDEKAAKEQENASLTGETNRERQYRIGLRQELVVEVGAKFLKGCRQIIGQDSAFANDRHKVGITDPTRDYMQVQMMFHSGAGTSSQVHP